jgi:hypothetical protein
MTLAELMEEIGNIVVDSSLEPFYKRWINMAILEIAADFTLPALRLNEPALLPVTTATWLYDVPANFQKQLFRAANSEFSPINIMPDLNDLDNRDLDHDDTGDHVTAMAVRDQMIGVYPLAAESIKLWYYKLPAVLDAGSDIPTCIPAAYHSRVIISKVVVKNFRALQDMVIDAPHQSIMFWQSEYKKGLYGEPYGDIGMVNFLAREKPPRRHGGRDPIGGYYGGRY